VSDSYAGGLPAIPSEPSLWPPAPDRSPDPA